MTDWLRETFENVERVYSLVDSFPFRVFEGKIPNIPWLEQRKYETAADTSRSHVNERIVKEFSIRIGDVTVLFVSEEFFLPSPDVWDNGIEVVVRVPE